MTKEEFKIIKVLFDKLKIINEELSKPKTRIFKGLGASHSYHTKTTKALLGDPPPFSGEAEEKPDKVVKKPISISRAFKK